MTTVSTTTETMTTDSMNMADIKPIEILLVEDNPGDARLVARALREAKLLNRLRLATDGAEALMILRRQHPHTAVPRPGLILLDLNLPKMNGFQVLAELKHDPDLRRIPVVILTSSETEQDVLRSYDLHANCYVSKPLSVDRFVSVVLSLHSFWFTIVRLPGSEPE